MRIWILCIVIMGMAASLFKQHSTPPRGAYEKPLEELKALAAKGVPKR